MHKKLSTLTFANLISAGSAARLPRLISLGRSTPGA